MNGPAWLREAQENLPWARSGHKDGPPSSLRSPSWDYSVLLGGRSAYVPRSWSWANTFRFCLRCSDAACGRGDVFGSSLNVNRGRRQLQKSKADPMPLWPFQKIKSCQAHRLVERRMRPNCLRPSDHLIQYHYTLRR